PRNGRASRPYRETDNNSGRLSKLISSPPNYVDGHTYSVFRVAQGQDWNAPSHFFVPRTALNGIFCRNAAFDSLARRSSEQAVHGNFMGNQWIAGRLSNRPALPVSGGIAVIAMHPIAAQTVRLICSRDFCLFREKASPGQKSDFRRRVGQRISLLHITG